MNGVVEQLQASAAAAEIRRMRSLRPLVQCITNDVVQEVTANVLLACGMSPAMVPGLEECAEFARGAADALLCNVGTPNKENVQAMKLAAEAAAASGKPWTLDPVGAGGTAWRDRAIEELIALRPTVIRGNGSEILAAAGFEHSYKGVDSLDSSDSALEAAQALASRSGSVVCVTGETDYVTDGRRTLSVSGGCAMVTLVVGTGCALSAMTAGFAAGAPDPLASTAACCLLAKRAAERAGRTARAPGSFHNAYLDALYLLTPEEAAGLLTA